MGTPVYATAKVSCYGGVQQLKASARQCPPLGAALAVQNQNGGAQVPRLVNVSWKIVL